MKRLVAALSMSSENLMITRSCSAERYRNEYAGREHGLSGLVDVLRDCPLSCLAAIRTCGGQLWNMARSLQQGPSASAAQTDCARDIGPRQPAPAARRTAVYPTLGDCTTRQAAGPTVTNLSIGQRRLQQFVTYVYVSSTRSWQVQVDQQ